MKCYYELLEVERDIDPEELKKKYRKLALKWHPDKNPDKVEECTAYFALLQQAYDVLSDPRERDFYDRHRESFLRGGDAEESSKSLDLIKFHSTSCFDGFGSDDKGFYAVYRKVFDTLASEDYDTMDKYDEKDYPRFGDENSNAEEIVSKFYGFWGSFSTKRSFSWLDQYDIRQGQNRYQVRKIEQENSKYRDIGRQERNEQIRELVAFVRRRDPRVKAYKKVLDEQQEEARKKQAENRKKQIAQNQQLLQDHLEDKDAEAARLAHLVEVSMKMAEDYDTCSDECDEDDNELPFCVVCNKSFKSMNAKINHENSKQHIKQLNQLKKHMKEEDANLFENQEQSEEPAATQPTPKGKKNKNKAKKGNGIFDCEPIVADSFIDESAVAESDEVKPKEDEEAEAEVKETEDAGVKKEKKKRRAGKGKAEEPEKPVDTTPKTGKCDRCKEVFESRTQLFAHLQETGHATLLVNKKAEPKKKNKKGKRNDDDEDW